MSRIRIRLVVLMTENTFENFIIIRINVTIGANVPSALVSSGKNRKIEVVVIPGGLFPVGGVMALFAGSGKSDGLMIGIGGVVVIVLVAGETGGGGVAVTAGVAGDTGQNHMRAGQRELGLIVVEIRRRPAIGGVALGAIVVVIAGNVVGIGYIIEIILVAGPAVGGGTGIPARMAILAVQRKVGSRQGELGLTVIER